MGERIARFRTPEIATRYYELYDDMVERHWPVAHEELDIPTRFGVTHVRRSGPESGTPIVMIHSTSGSSAGWYPLIGALAARHPVYTPDTIGTAGRSVQEKPIDSATDLSVWLDEVLDALALDRVHLLGYSEGGWIAGTHAGTTPRPDRLASLTLIEPAGAIERIPRPVIATMVAKGAMTLWARDKRQAIQDFNSWLNGDLELSEDQLDMVMFVFGNFRQKLPTPGRMSDEQLRRITTPTLLLLAENTILYDPAKVAAKARRLLPDVTVEIIPDAGHGVAYQYPDRVTSRVLAHADAVDRDIDHRH